MDITKNMGKKQQQNKQKKEQTDKQKPPANTKTPGNKGGGSMFAWQIDQSIVE